MNGGSRYEKPREGSFTLLGRMIKSKSVLGAGEHASSEESHHISAFHTKISRIGLAGLRATKKRSWQSKKSEAIENLL